MCLSAAQQDQPRARQVQTDGSLRGHWTRPDPQEDLEEAVDIGEAARNQAQEEGEVGAVNVNVQGGTSSETNM